MHGVSLQNHFFFLDLQETVNAYPLSFSARFSNSIVENYKKQIHTLPMTDCNYRFKNLSPTNAPPTKNRFSK